MQEFQLGDLVLMEIALSKYSENIDISLFAAQQIQDIVMKIEMNIQKIAKATEPMRVVPLGEETSPKPTA